jgi:glycosyltransferase involved in cell wall biosynthesis
MTRRGVRVLQLVTRLNIGGPARHALLIARLLGSEFPMTLAAGYPTPTEGEMSDPAVAVRRVPLVRPVRPADDVRALWAVRRLLVEERPALVATHMAKAGAVGRLTALSVRPRPRLVHTFHGHVFEGYFSPAARRAFLETERWLARTTDALVAVSSEVRDELLGLGIGRPEQYRVLPLGIDLEPFLAIDRPDGRLRAHLGIGPGTPLVGMVGRLVPIKDGDTMLAAIARLEHAHLAVVGDGEERDRLERKAASLGISARVHFVGWWDDVAGAMSDLDVVALSSRNEGTPSSLIEALAARRPVVATRVGGVASVVDDEETGSLVPAGDPDTLADRIDRLLRDPAHRRALGDRGRERVRQRFGIDRWISELRALYSELLSR